MRNLIYISIFSVSICFGQTKAFPSAEGFGKYATGGRGGDIYHVTNRNDSGSGSLRYGIDQTGARMIVFDVGGIIQLLTPIIISAGTEGDLTIAGETAPSPGITIEGTAITGDNGAMLDIRDGNVIIRYLSVRINNSNTGDNDCIRIINTTSSSTMTDIILDHISMSNGADELCSVVGSSGKLVSNVTIQYTMMGKPDTPYNFLGGEYVYNTTLYSNYFSHASSRSPFIGWGKHDEEFEIINNVMYCTNGTTNIAFGNHVDLIGNVYTESDELTPTYRAVSYEVSSFNNPTAVESDGSLYVADNFFDGDWSAGTYQSSVVTYAKGSRVITDSYITSWADTQTDIENQVLPTVGNSLYRDSMDATLVADYAARTGTLTYVTPPSKTPSSRNMGVEDSDSDDMLDVAEIAIWGSIEHTDNPIGDDDSDGYTNIEETWFYLIDEDSPESEPETTSSSNAGARAFMNYLLMN